ncbi:MAG TPA: ABC transporter permease [Polyangiaceae bacterium]|jgi:lipopolysaccharide transport system permease protein|nr:ABC transporter permease [Polyangiaceae bacterium]
MTEAAASTEQPHLTQWVHRSARGIELGGEVPTGKVEPGYRAFVSAIRLAVSLRETFWALVAKDFKARYRAQSLGLFWSIAHPLVMMLTTTVAFEWVLKVQIANFPIFYLIGAILWQLFANVLTGTTSSMLDNAGLIKHTTFPRFLFPISTVFSNLIPFGMELVLVFAFFPVFPGSYHLNESLLALPFVLALEVILLIGLGLMTSSLNARYRDVLYLVTSVLTVGFWATPILYSSTMAPEWIRPFFLLNPMGFVIESTRGIVMKGTWPSAPYMAAVTVESLLVFVAGAAVFRRQGRKIADYV